MADRPTTIIVTSQTNDVVPPPGYICTTADEYLAGSGSCSNADAHVINLCRDVSYGSKGYYVSLLADARGQDVLPRVETLSGLSEPYARFRALQEAGAPTIDAGEMAVRWRAVEQGGTAVALEDRPAGAFPAPLVAEAGGALRLPAAHELVETLVCIGTCTDARFQQAARAVYREWPAPLLRLQLVLEEGVWKISQVAPASPHELSPAEQQQLQSALEEYGGRRQRPQLRPATRASLAVLVDASQFSPSSPETIDRLERVAARMNVHLARLSLQELRRLPEYDALFIRSHTSVTHHAFQFALRAEALGMPVVDASNATIRCTNKVFMQELLTRAGLRTPRSLIVSSATPWQQIEELGLPFVLKLPDGDFSAAVHKVTAREDYERYLRSMLRRSPLLIAQEWLPTKFDWRIGVLGGRLLFAARYHMAQGHWQIRTVEQGTERYGKVEAIPRTAAPAEVAELALGAAALIGDGFYGVDIKETASGPVVIEVNDNANLDIGYEDTADGDAIYEDIINYFLMRIDAVQPTAPELTDDSLDEMRLPIELHEAPRRPYRLFEVTGIELEYPIVDGDLNVKSLVEPAFRMLAGRGTSDVDLGAIGFSNEFADHVFEIKTQQPVSALTEIEQLLYEGVQRFTAVLRDEWGARLCPTGMHPWFDPMAARLWTRSGLRVYTTYARLFNVRTHGWMNVQAAHVNLPFGTEEETVAMYNAAALLIPYLPALAASSPIYDGQLQPVTDGRMDFLTRIQSRVPESCGRMVPEFIASFADYRRNILQPMYAAVDRLHDAGAIRYEFFNTRAAILRFSRKALEIRVLDTQECVKMDIAVAAFTRYALQYLTHELLQQRVQLPEHELLVGDFHQCIHHGSNAQVHAPFVSSRPLPVRAVLEHLLTGARSYAPPADAKYLDLVERVIETGSLAERIRAELEPEAGRGAEEFREAVRRIYIELADCLEANEPWQRRWR